MNLEIFTSSSLSFSQGLACNQKYIIFLTYLTIFRVENIFSFVKGELAHSGHNFRGYQFQSRSFCKGLKITRFQDLHVTLLILNVYFLLNPHEWKIRESVPQQGLVKLNNCGSL